MEQKEAAVTGTTSHIYRTAAGSSLLMVSPLVLEYGTPQLAFTTTWDNVKTLTHGLLEDELWLSRMPRFTRQPRRRVRVVLRLELLLSISLRPFGYPANQALTADLARFAPHIGHLLR